MVYWDEWKYADVAIFFVAFVISVILVFFLDIVLDFLEKKQYYKRVIPGRYSSVVIFCSIFLCWLVVFLTFYPGSCSYDSYQSIQQSLTQITSNAHPVLFTLFVKVCIQTGLALFHNMNAAVALFSIVQMLILAVVLTYTVQWLANHNAPLLFIILTIIYYSANPIIVRYSFTMWKDIMFSAVILLLVLFLYDLVTDERKSLQDNKTLLQLIILSVLASFLRNRIIYGVMVCFFILVFIEKQGKRKLFMVFSAVSMFVLVIQGPVYDVLEIEKSNFAEGQGVSLQQIAAVVVQNGNISDVELEFIEHIIPLEDIPKAYKASTVDSLKYYESFDNEYLNNHSGKYLQVWAGIIWKNPWIATKAWLMTTRGFWGFNVWTDPWVVPKDSKTYGVYWVNYLEKITGVDLSGVWNGIAYKAGTVPILRRVLDLGSMGWIGMFCVVRQITKKRYKVVVALMPLIILWLVLIFTTPLFFEPRYMFAFNLAMPFWGSLLIMGDQLRLSGCLRSIDE